MEEEVKPVEAAVEEKEPVGDEGQITEGAKVEEVKVEDTLPPPKKKTAQERIDEITRARREAEREAEYWRKVALEKETKDKITEPPVTPQQPQRPVISQFETTEAYEDALLNWHETKKATETAVIKQREEQEVNLRKFNIAAAEARKKYEDFDDVVEAPVFSQQMRESIFGSDVGPELAYFLGLPENRITADAIRAMPPQKQYYEMGKLETRLTLAQKTKKVTSAPAPINPVGISGGGVEDDSKLTIEQWMAREKQREIDKWKKKYGG